MIHPTVRTAHTTAFVIPVVVCYTNVLSALLNKTYFFLHVMQMINKQR